MKALLTLTMMTLLSCVVFAQEQDSQKSIKVIPWSTFFESQTDCQEFVSKVLPVLQGETVSVNFKSEEEQSKACSTLEKAQVGTNKFTRIMRHPMKIIAAPLLIPDALLGGIDDPPEMMTEHVWRWGKDRPAKGKQYYIVNFEISVELYKHMWSSSNRCCWYVDAGKFTIDEPNLPLFEQVLDGMKTDNKITIDFNRRKLKDGTRYRQTVINIPKKFIEN